MPGFLLDKVRRKVSLSQLTSFLVQEVVSSSSPLQAIKQEDEDGISVKTEPPESPSEQQQQLLLQQQQQQQLLLQQQQQQQQVPSNIRFSDFDPLSWHRTFSRHLSELPPLTMVVTADKGFVFSAVDCAFIAQKKNHFQLTCHVQVRSRLTPLVRH